MVRYLVTILFHLLSVTFILCAATLAAWGQEQDPHPSWYVASPATLEFEQSANEIHRRTPRETVRNFIDLIEAGRFRDAAHYLNLTDLPAENRLQNGMKLARELALVIDRQIWIDWAGLPARADAMLEAETSHNALAGEPRRDIILKQIKLDGQVYDIRLGRYKAPEAQPVWLFTPQTVQNIPTLFEAYGPRPFEALIPIGLTKRIWGLSLWEWLLLPAILGALFGLGWLVSWIVGWFSRRASPPILHQGLEKSRIPLGFVTVAIIAQLMLKLGVSFSGPTTTILRPFLLVVMVAGLGLTALKIVDAILDRITARVVGDIDDMGGVDKRELYTSIYALRRIIVLLMVGVAFFVILARLNFFASLGMSVLASAGVLTILLGIAGQAVLGNMMASLQIALAKPIRIGDSIFFEKDWAYVESIFYTFLRLRTWDERRIIVPVKYFVSQPFENWSVKDARILKTITVFLDHRADIRGLREVFKDLAKQDEGVIEYDKLFAAVTEHRQDGQEISFYAMCPDPSTGWAVAMRLREALLAHIRNTHPGWWPQERASCDSLGGVGES